MRRQPQRGFVVGGRGFEIAPNHAGIAEIRMQFRNGLDGCQPGRLTFDRSKTALKHLDRLIDSASGIMFPSNGELSANMGRNGIGFGRGSG